MNFRLYPMDTQTCSMDFESCKFHFLNFCITFPIFKLYNDKNKTQSNILIAKAISSVDTELPLLMFSFGNFFYPFSHRFSITNFVKNLCLILKDSDIENFYKIVLDSERYNRIKP